MADNVQIPEDLKFGYVTDRVLLAIGDGDDEDRFPDVIPAVGSVTFTPIAPNQLVYGGTATIAKQAVTCRIGDDGNLLGPSGWSGVWLVVGEYDVRYSLTGAKISTVRIRVEEKHTPEDPLVIARHAPLEPTPGVKFVVNEQVYLDTLAAAQRAEDAVEGIADVVAEEIGRDEEGRLHSTPLGAEIFVEDLGDAVVAASDAYLLGTELLSLNAKVLSLEAELTGTGSRNITSLVPDATGGQVLISRRGPVVELALVNLYLSGAAAWGALGPLLPVGFRPALAAAEAQLIGSTTGIISIRRSDGRIDINRLGPTVRHKLTFTYLTNDPVPTGVLPGVPA